MFLICTSTLIEGVNTKAKNIIIFDNTLFKKKLDYFTFNNICGRSGRMFEHFVGKVFLFHDPPARDLPQVDFPVFTQGSDVPSELLIQLSDEDVHDNVRERVDDLITQTYLPIDIIRKNTSIDPEAQIDLARHLERSPQEHWPYLSWASYPTKAQLDYACTLVWEFLVPNKQRRGGVSSGVQLSFKLRRLSQVRDSRALVLEELANDFKPPSPNEAVENVLEFERTWATFEFPRYIMALSRIQEHVFGSIGLQPGDYSFYSMQVESLFRTPVLISLDEYGVPLQVAEKIGEELGIEDDLDSALAYLKRVDVTKFRLSPFERDVIEDAKATI